MVKGACLSSQENRSGDLFRRPGYSALRVAAQREQLDRPRLAAERLASDAGRDDVFGKRRHSRSGFEASKSWPAASSMSGI